MVNLTHALNEQRALNQLLQKNLETMHANREARAEGRREQAELGGLQAASGGPGDAILSQLAAAATKAGEVHIVFGPLPLVADLQDQSRELRRELRDELDSLQVKTGKLQSEALVARTRAEQLEEVRSTKSEIGLMCGHDQGTDGGYTCPTARRDWTRGGFSCGNTGCPGMPPAPGGS